MKVSKLFDFSDFYECLKHVGYSISGSFGKTSLITVWTRSEKGLDKAITQVYFTNFDGREYSHFNVKNKIFATMEKDGIHIGDISDRVDISPLLKSNFKDIVGKDSEGNEIKTYKLIEQPNLNDVLRNLDVSKLEEVKTQFDVLMAYDSHLARIIQHKLNEPKALFDSH